MITKFPKVADNGAYHRQLKAWNLEQFENHGAYYQKSKRNHQNFYGRSPIEEKLAEILKLVSPNFKRNQYIDKYEVDFLLEDKKLVIEANGKFYHNPQKDSRKANYLYKLGYRVIQVRGTDIVNHPWEVFKNIKRKLKLMKIEIDIT